MAVKDEEELQGILRIPQCAVSGCNSTEVDPRGYVWMRTSEGEETGYKVCTPHWEPIFQVLGRQDQGHNDGNAETERPIFISEGTKFFSFGPIFEDEDGKMVAEVLGQASKVSELEAHEKDNYERGRRLMRGLRG